VVACLVKSRVMPGCTVGGCKVGALIDQLAQPMDIVGVSRAVVEGVVNVA
jgi:hypothetical protein